MTRLLRWTRWARRAAATSGLLRHPTRAAERVVGRWLDGEGRALYEASGVPALSVLLRFADGGEVVRHWGMASPGVALGRETLFQVLSISKPVTALLALALVDDGVLDLDEPIWRRLPGWRLPASRTGGFDVEGVTLRRLLAHEAGCSVRGFGWGSPGTRTPPRALCEQEGDEETTLRLVAAPGSGLRYSGGGFALVQGLIEEAAGAPFAEVARRRLFEPLGVRASGYEPELDGSPDLATRHDAEGRPLPSAGLASCAASGLVARAEDVATLFALPAPGRRGGAAGRGILSPGACATMLAPHAADDRRAVSGLGVFLKERRGDLKYMHAGFDPGWTCRAEGLVRRRVVIVLLSNGEQGQRCVPAMAHALRHRLYDAVP